MIKYCFINMRNENIYENKSITDNIAGEYGF